jgi:hypothetical protein
VALVRDGRILAADAPDEITRGFGRTLLAVRAPDRYRALLALRGYPHAHSVFPFGETLHYTDRRVDLPADRLAGEVAGYLRGQGLGEVEVAPAAATIEDSFMELMG